MTNMRDNFLHQLIGKPALATAMAAAMLLVPQPLCAALEADHGQIARHVGTLLESRHFNQENLDDDLSALVLNQYLEMLDYNRMFFTAEDIEGFKEEYGSALDEEISNGGVKAAFHIHSVFQERVNERVEQALKLLEEEFSFDSDRTVELSRQESEWANQEEMDELWRNRVEGELLEQKLAGNEPEEALDTLSRRYQRLLRSVEEQEEEDVLKLFLTALAQTYDPHSEYLTPSDLENFQINMQLSLIGIGAMLRSVDGFAEIVELVPGGPAERSGELQPNDRILGVAQGDEEFVDVVDMKLDRIVEMIRGSQGSTVRLQVQPGEATDPSERVVVELVRDEIELKDKEARAELIEFTDRDGNDRRLGWITLPSFYLDMNRPFDEDRKSTTRDVEALLKRLMEEGMDGLVMDLRRNGGGSLEEVINLTGLFIEQGPVVQSKELRRAARAARVPGNNFLYDGPMVVLTSRVSASASEIFAAALQDYGRAVVVGDSSTFGKGTVQEMLDLSRFMSLYGRPASNAGALKLTVQKFYRIAGGSTQLKGVAPDIVLPSIREGLQIGESALRNPMPYDEVDPVDFEPFADLTPILDRLREASERRVEEDLEFQFVLDDVERIRRQTERNQISLNLVDRKAEREEAEQRRENREAARKEMERPSYVVYELSLDNIDAPLELVEEVEGDGVELVDTENGGRIQSTDIDPTRDEALHILSDLIELGPKAVTAGTSDR